MIDKYESFLQELFLCRAQTLDFLSQDRYKAMFEPDILRDAVYSYVARMGKAMRPAAILWAAGAMSDGKRTELALAAAAAIEIFHTYSLVHDDIIDRDTVRRGGPSVHTEYSAYAKNTYQLSQGEAEHFGLSMGILAGDTQLCWCMAILAEYLTESEVNPNVATHIIYAFTNRLFPVLPSGELLDIEFSLLPPAQLTSERVLDMYYRKTGITFEIAAEVGGAIGLNATPADDSRIRNLSEFARLSGLAFQLQDDLLGIVGDSASTKKPVGADIREGKRTFTILHAYEHADDATRTKLDQTLGNPETTEDEIASVVDLLDGLGSISATRDKAKSILDQANSELNYLPGFKVQNPAVPMDSLCNRTYSIGRHLP